MSSSSLVLRGARSTSRASNSLRASSRAFHEPPKVYRAQEKDPQLGDYPDLPWVSNQQRSPYGWWDPQMRRNFNEPASPSPLFCQLLSMWGPDVAPVPPQTALRQFLLAAGSFVSFGFLVKYALTPDRPAVPREYPYSGLVTELGGLDANKVWKPP
ncbi:hypothetical protein CONPUDRAFT_50068 [Coniophora puteana RWD-64-598 SS2]|uniref:Uncharacterized protein n=1 Tax=Coniophora puteana (strain RWD-64-598) TaxID=741705 RepID=A0A5M3MZ64_CONPW|nr:uncharacterized protein CONPUDRAFT_50068 [Coniophora puteana RWD-64-598 SS2]EIW84326.1 hypothetical protein CONPUDRAFT_50068 [Coniophora puteana RWD-64-598 SS2]